jgi:RNA polymerase sigma factor (sigma-70 family)
MVAVRTGPTDDVELARRAVGGDGPAFAELFDRWFDRAFDVAWHIVRNRDTAAEVAQDTFATAWQQIATLRRPESFGGWILRIARNKGLNRLAADQRARPAGDPDALADHDAGRRASDDAATPVTDQERDDLVWAASAALGDDDASILSLHLRHGLGAPELADELGIAPNAAHQRLFRLKKRLGDAIGAWMLWHLGRPRCDALRTLLANAGTTRFDRDAAAMITAHTRGCPDCNDRRAVALSPEVMFGAMPLVVAGPTLKARAAAALAANAVPTPPPASPPATPGTPEISGRGESTSGAPDAPTTPGTPGTPGTPEISGRGESTSGGPPVGAEGVPGSRLARRTVALAAAAAVVLGVAVVALATRGSDPDLVAAPSDGTTTTDASTEAEPVAATTTVPAAVSTTAPGEGPVATATPVTDPPGPGLPPSTTAPPPPPQPPDPQPEPEPDPPTIDGFRAGPLVTGNCGDPNQTLTRFSWSSTGATSARLGQIGGAATPVDTTGEHTACALTGSSWTLTVSGDGGTDTAVVTVTAG